MFLKRFYFCRFKIRAARQSSSKNILYFAVAVALTVGFLAVADDKMSCDDFLSLRTEMFGSLIFYLSDDNLNCLLGELNGITNIHNHEEMVSVFARITNILQDDLAGQPYTPDRKEHVLTDLWHQFGSLARSCPKKGVTSAD